MSPLMMRVRKHGTDSCSRSIRPIERGNEVKRSPLRRKSSKQRSFDDELMAVTPELYERAQFSCELMIPNCCVGREGYLHRHHRRSRRIRKDGKANALSNLLLVCLPCHTLIHHERAWSKVHGFTISSNADPDEVHVNRTGIYWMPRKGRT
jgi:hypothetical protein